MLHWFDAAEIQVTELNILKYRGCVIDVFLLLFDKDLHKYLPSLN